MDQQQQKRVEALGPAERILSSLLTFTDHLVHNRPGMVSKDPSSPVGVKWEQVIWKEEDGKKNVYKAVKVGKKTSRVLVGAMNGSTTIKNGRATVGEYRKPGLFPETVEFFYKAVADVWRMDNEFCASWASWAYPREHRDLKAVLCAFMLVQSRRGDPIIEDGEILFRDDDFRNVGEAMCLIPPSKTSDKSMNPKLLLRVGDILNLPAVAAINREMKFGNSARNPAMGRYYKTVEKWLRYREENLPLLEGLVKAGFRSTVMRLASRVGYKPATPKFFEVLRWKQAQAKDGRRTLAIGKAVKKAETWEGKSEKDICEIIEKNKPDWKRIVGLLPKSIGLTAAIVAVSVENGCLSNQDLIILTPTLEDLGLLKNPGVQKRWKAAIDKAENQRAANIARNVKTKEAKDGLQDAVDKSTEKAMKEVTKDMRVYVVVDKSGSMEGALERAQAYLTKFLGGFPLDKTHVSVFNTIGTEIIIKAPKAAAVKQAFKGHHAGGGTIYAEGVRALKKHKPKENEDAIIIFVGDELDNNPELLAPVIEKSGINPVAFGLLKVTSTQYGGGNAVTLAARQLGIPCFQVDEKMFTSDDPYAINRMMRDLIASTPVGARPRTEAPARKTLVQEIMETPLLTKPVWA